MKKLQQEFRSPSESKFRLVLQKCIFAFSAETLVGDFAPQPRMNLATIVAVSACSKHSFDYATVLITLRKSKGGKNGKKKR